MESTPNRLGDRCVCVLGMGFVGVTLAAVMAEVGFEVIGVDIRRDLVAMLNAGDPHFFEPGLREKLQAAVRVGRLRAFERIPDRCPATVYIITVGTPLSGNGRTDLTSIRAISRQIAAHVRDGDLVVVRSTVRGPAIIGPGTVLEDSLIGPSTSIGEECRVTGSEIEDSIVMEQCVIEDVRAMGGSILGRAVHVRRQERPSLYRFVAGDQSQLNVP